MTRQQDLIYIIENAEEQIKELVYQPNKNYSLINELKTIRSKAQIEYLRNLLNEVGNK